MAWRVNTPSDGEILVRRMFLYDFFKYKFFSLIWKVILKFSLSCRMLPRNSRSSFFLMKGLWAPGGQALWQNSLCAPALGTMPFREPSRACSTCVFGVQQWTTAIRLLAPWVLQPGNKRTNPSATIEWISASPQKKQLPWQALTRDV